MIKILAIGAHYDDIEMGVGGTLARFVKNNHEVYTIVVSSSDYANYDGKKLRTKYQSDKEGYAGLIKLGVPTSNIINLKYNTKQIPYNDKIVEKINTYIDKIKPDLIITHHLNAESHQDHLNTVKSVVAASRYQKNIWMMEPLYPSKLSNIPFRPIVYVDISETLSIKIESLKLHSSQWKKYPHWKDLIVSVAKIRGIEIQAEYAEAFEPIKMEYKI